ncbi:hypothetical protein RDI58_014869 [Solanum bulbocastanum]|uniref:Uncharacterized protein n=1 Tax=Solanum bulbocastanum TaxID=147425 RepID=A0AAN8TE83_SOLBU
MVISFRLLSKGYVNFPVLNSRSHMLLLCLIQSLELIASKDDSNEVEELPDHVVPPAQGT